MRTRVRGLDPNWKPCFVRVGLPVCVGIIFAAAGTGIVGMAAFGEPADPFRLSGLAWAWSASSSLPAIERRLVTIRSCFERRQSGAQFSRSCRRSVESLSDDAGSFSARACARSKDNANTDWKANTHEAGQMGVGQAANVDGILCAVHL